MLGQGVIGQLALGQPEEAAGTTVYTLAAGIGRFHLTGYGVLLGKGTFMYPAAGAFAISSVGCTPKITMPVAPGAFTLTGRPAKNQIRVHDAGMFLVDPHRASLIYVAGRGIIAAPGSFVVTGNGARRRYTLKTAAGAFALSGNSAKNQIRVHDPGSFQVTGIPVFMASTRQLAPAAGAFTLSGHAADLAKGKFLQAGTGHFTLTGNGITTLLSKLHGTGSFLLSGNGAGARLTMPGPAGAFTLTGVATAMTFTRQLAAGTGHFTVTGNPAGLTQQLGAAPGAFALAPQNASMIHVRNGLIAAAGGFVVAGNDATAIRTRKLFAGAGAYAWSGKPANLVRTRVLVADPGDFHLTGFAAGLSQQLGAAPGAFTLSSGQATLLYHRRMPTAAGAFALTPGAITPTITLLAGTGSFTVTGQDARLTKAVAKLIAGTGRFLLQPGFAAFNEEVGIATMRWQATARGHMMPGLTARADVDPAPPTVNVYPYAESDVLATVEDPAVVRLRVLKTAMSRIDITEQE